MIVGHTADQHETLEERLGLSAAGRSREEIPLRVRSFEAHAMSARDEKKVLCVGSGGKRNGGFNLSGATRQEGREKIGQALMVDLFSLSPTLSYSVG